MKEELVNVVWRRHACLFSQSHENTNTVYGQNTQGIST